jgi:hypothetical protein
LDHRRGPVEANPVPLRPHLMRTPYARAGWRRPDLWST